jgi:hypothetical protein
MEQIRRKEKLNEKRKEKKWKGIKRKADTRWVFQMISRPYRLWKKNEGETKRSGKQNKWAERKRD